MVNFNRNPFLFLLLNIFFILGIGATNLHTEIIGYMQYEPTEDEDVLNVSFETFLLYAQKKRNIDFLPPLPEDQHFANALNLMSEQLRFMAGQYLSGYSTRNQLGQALAGYTVGRGTPEEVYCFRTMIRNIARLTRQTSPLKATQTEIPLRPVKYKHSKVIINIVPTLLIRRRSKVEGIRCGAVLINMERPCLNQKGMQLALPLLQYFVQHYYNATPNQVLASDLCYCYDIFTGRTVKGIKRDIPDYTRINKQCERMYSDWQETKA